MLLKKKRNWDSPILRRLFANQYLFYAGAVTILHRFWNWFVFILPRYLGLFYTCPLGSTSCDHILKKESHLSLLKLELLKSLSMFAKKELKAILKFFP